MILRETKTSSAVADKNFLLKKSQKSAQNVDLDKAVYTWLTQERARGTPLSGPIVMAKALSFCLQLKFILFTKHFVALFKIMCAQKGGRRKRTAVNLETKLEILKKN